jgi:hypothetical protein
MPNISNIPSARVPVLDEKGVMSRQWYRYFFNLFNLTNAGSSPTSADDLALAPQTDVPQGLSYGPSYPIGYGNGAGSTVTQITSRNTDVTINTVCGQITLFSATTTISTFASFTVTNSAVAATDVVIINIGSGATADRYNVTVTAVAAGSFRVQIHNVVAVAVAEAPVLNFAVIKAVTV